ncbi:MAG: phosphoenolpyruvate carboxykinase [Nitrospinae bacterium]|nr:phosphoenolpyruvate carboxykinase [Nitrospinota bacterium]
MHREIPMKSAKMPYSIVNDSKVVIDYSAIFCGSPGKLLKSELFLDVTTRFFKKIAEKKTPTYLFLKEKMPHMEESEMPAYVINLLRLLVAYTADELAAAHPEFAGVLGTHDREWLFSFRRDLYNYWRRFERFIYLEMPKKAGQGGTDIHHAHFVHACENLRNLILDTNRIVGENLSGREPKVYRQLPAGGNMGMALEKIDWKCPKFLSQLKDIPFIRLTFIEPPLILYSRSNTRKGMFKEVPELTEEMAAINPHEWFCFPLKVGELTAFVYFDHSYISMGLAMCNLFEIANFDDIAGKLPDAIVMVGVSGKGMKEMTEFYEDKHSGLLVGLVKKTEQTEYFGYFKKMTLTLHNVAMIKRGRLPVHGAMVNIKLRDGGSANVAIMGDSGAGKSETLEALRTIAEENFSEMKIIFDDMGSLAVDKDGRVIGYGTEIGAFVRLDDLSPKYAYEEIDRSIFINPDKKNARLVVPISPYKDIVHGYPVDMFLYANNYEPLDDGRGAIEFFPNVEDALEVFRGGARLAKGTTDEKGLVHTYFANPFGANQRKADHEKIAVHLFNAMFKSGVKVGQIRTRLGIEGFEQEGPKAVAVELNKVILELSKGKA